LKRIILLIFLLICVSYLNAQNNVTSRVQVLNGAGLDVYFYRLADYSAGITFDNYTRLGVYFNDTIATGIGNPAGNGWQLKIKPDGDLQSLFTTSSIPIDVVDIRVLHNAIETNFTLVGGEQIIASGPDKVAYGDVIVISYDIGKTNPINVVSNERYAVNLEFILEPQP
jgi:hypothetical protein